MITGFYFCGNEIVEIIRRFKVSPPKELEISHIKQFNLRHRETKKHLITIDVHWLGIELHEILKTNVVPKINTQVTRRSANHA